MRSPTARSLAHLRKRGAIAAVVERWNPHAKVRQDLFGCLDLIALEPGLTGVLGVQATTVSNQAARVSKILSEPRALAWIGAGNRLEVWGFAKRGPRGKRKRWSLSVTEVTVESFRVATA